MITEEQMKKIEDFAGEKYKDFSDTHNMEGHINLVLKHLELLVQKEGGDIQTCKAAALLHDIGYVHSRKQHAKYGVDMASKFLKSIELDENTITRILHCIESHGLGWKKERTTPEARVVADADRLETLGPWGIIRVLEDALVIQKMSVNEALIYSENFIEKALKSLNTQTAKELAKPLYEHSKGFFELLKKQRGF